MDTNSYDVIACCRAAYVDTCALVKIDAKEEPGSNFVRTLVYLSRIPVYSSFVGFGEFFKVVGEKQYKGGPEGFLFVCRQLMNDFDMKKIQRAEPVPDRREFLRLAEVLLAKYARRGGADIWHLMAAMQLKTHEPESVFLSFDNDLCKAASSEGLLAVYCQDLDANELATRLAERHKIVDE